MENKHRILQYIMSWKESYVHTAQKQNLNKNYEKKKYIPLIYILICYFCPWRPFYAKYKHISECFAPIQYIYLVTATHAIFFRKYASQWKIFQIAYRLWPGISEYKQTL
jgi:hypothetical protein